jgi:hypothetical protein
MGDQMRQRSRAGVDTRLCGWRLICGRTATLGVILLSVALFVLTAPARLQQLNDIAVVNSAALASLRLPVEVLPAVVAGCDFVLFAAYFLVAMVIFFRRSDDRIGLFVTIMLATLATTLTRPMDSVQSVPPFLHLPYVLVVSAGALAVCTFLYLFPNSYFVPRWTRWPARVFGALNVIWFFLPPLLGLWPFWPPRDWPLAFVLVWMIGGLSLQIYRYTRISSPAQRQQTKWIMFGLIVATLGFLSFPYFTPLLIPSVRVPGVARIVYILIGVPLMYAALFALPLSLAFSILRYRLWDVDLIFQRTLVYGALTAGLGLVYFGCVLLLQQLFRILTGTTNVLAIVISTIIIALMFDPLRRSAQAIIDRRLYRRKYDAAQTLEKFSLVAREEVDLDRLTGQLVAVVQEAMQPEHVSVWLKKR